MPMPQNLKVLSQIVDRLEKLEQADLLWLSQKISSMMDDNSPKND